VGVKVLISMAMVFQRSSMVQAAGFMRKALSFKNAISMG